MQLGDLKSAMERYRQLKQSQAQGQLPVQQNPDMLRQSMQARPRQAGMLETMMGVGRQFREDPLNALKVMANRAISGPETNVTTGLEPGPIEKFMGRGSRSIADSVQDFYSSKVPEFLARQNAPQAIQNIAKVGGAIAGTGSEIIAQSMDESSPAFSQAAIGFHGSAHLFDKFNIKKIGTGEGAQAYGHGLYFAENKNVANQYMLAGNEQKIQFFPLVEYKGVDVAKQNLTPTQKAAINLIATDGHEQAIKYANNSGRKELAEEIRRIPKSDVVNKMIERTPPGLEGNMYKVDIPDEKVAGMLDWDKPLSEQVGLKRADPDLYDKMLGNQKELDSLVKQKEELVGMDLSNASDDVLNSSQSRLDAIDGKINELHKLRKTNNAGDGEAFYRALSEKHGSDEKASMVLGSKGIPGIKYLDQGSRGRTAWEVVAPQGGINEFPNEAQARAFLKNNPEGKLKPPDQTRNIVAFDDKIVNILEVNGKKVKK